jgi:hypothetical protein
MQTKIPEQPKNSFRVTLDLDAPEKRLDSVLLDALRNQEEDEEMQATSRTKLKEWFQQGKVMIKGQKARPSSSLAKGITYVDLLVK